MPSVNNIVFQILAKRIYFMLNVLTTKKDSKNKEWGQEETFGGDEYVYGFMGVYFQIHPILYITLIQIFVCQRYLDEVVLKISKLKKKQRKVNNCSKHWWVIA